jgi:hypothetical protein
VRVLGRARLVDQPDDLDRLLDLRALGHVHEGTSGPERRGGSLELALVVGQSLGEVLLDQLRMLLQRLLERCEHDLVVAHVRVHDAGAALDQKAGVLLFSKVLPDDLRQLLEGLVAPRLQLVEPQLADVGGPEAGPPPARQRLALEDLERGLTAILHERGGHYAATSSRTHS